MNTHKISLLSFIILPLAISPQASFSGEIGTFEYSYQDARATITMPPDPELYYILRVSVELPFFSTARINLGTSGALWEISGEAPSGFFYVKSSNIYAPVDSLGDGIDDMFKISFGLDPVDPGLASRNSGFFSESGAPLSWGEYYRTHFDRLVAPKEGWSREVSTFNFGLPTSPLEAISREVSVMNGDLPRSSILEAYSREVSVFSFAAGTARLDSNSREVSVFNFGDPGSSYEAISRELSVFNGELGIISPIPEVYSREVSVFNHGTAIYSVDAVSREVSVQQLSINQTKQKTL